MKVFVLVDWGDSVIGVVSSKEKAVARRFLDYSDTDSSSKGFFVECEIDEEEQPE